MSYIIKLTKYVKQDGIPVFVGHALHPMEFRTIKAATPLADRINATRGKEYSRATIIQK